MPIHDLRHTGVALLVSEGADLTKVQAVCGHSSIRTTWDPAVRNDAGIFYPMQKQPYVFVVMAQTKKDEAGLEKLLLDMENQILSLANAAHAKSATGADRMNSRRILAPGQEDIRK